MSNKEIPQEVKELIESHFPYADKEIVGFSAGESSKFHQDMRRAAAEYGGDQFGRGRAAGWGGDGVDGQIVHP